MTVSLHGYHFSVYRRIARLALEEKSVEYETIEINPFIAPIPDAYLALHPFGRVPTLVHDGFTVYETSAITRYVDEAFDGPSLQPNEPRVRARMQQIVSVIDNYGYWPMVRQVFSHGFFRARQGLPVDRDQLEQGLLVSARVLSALESLATPYPFLLGNVLSLADLHLAPMMAYFVASPDGRTMLGHHPNLLAWWTKMSERPAVIATEPY